MHAVRKITRGILSPKFQSVRIVFEDVVFMLVYVAGMGYSRYALEHRNGSDLLTLESVQAMCRLDANIRRLSPLTTNCFRPATQHEHCCRSWSLSNYVALVANRSDCSETSREDVSEMRLLLARCVGTARR